MVWNEIVAGVLLSLGGGLLLIGGIGMLRFPHFYSRLHAGGVIDTLAAGLFLSGLAFLFGPNLGSVKLGVIFLLLLFTGPTACHALARAAYVSGLREPQQPEKEQQWPK